MLVIKFYQTPERGTIHMEVDGHAGTAPRGDDLVCCGASMLAFTVGQALRFLHHQGGQLQKKPKVQIGKGHARIVATPTEDGFPLVLNAFWVAQCGAHILADNYPEYVRLEHLKM